jgi:hypothetical protein
MQFVIITLNRIRGRPKRPKPLTPGAYTGQIKNVVFDELTGKMVMQFAVTEKKLDR